MAHVTGTTATGVRFRTDTFALLVKIAQTARAISGLVSNLPRAKPMFITATQCRAKAEEKLALAKRDPVHRRKLEDAARAWLILSDRMEDEPEEKE